jgi:hypothetical protein
MVLAHASQWVKQAAFLVILGSLLQGSLAQRLSSQGEEVEDVNLVHPFHE